MPPPRPESPRARCAASGQKLAARPRRSPRIAAGPVSRAYAEFKPSPTISPQYAALAIVQWVLSMELYRFYTFSDQKVATLLNGRLWFSSPQVFNDPADCRLELAIDSADRWASAKLIELAEDDLDAKRYLGPNLTASLIKLLELKRDCPGDIRNLLRLGPVQEYSDNPLVNLLQRNWLTIEIRNWILETTAVCCFVSSDPLNPLMWAHYADGHRGFCVKYEANLDDLRAHRALFAMNYMTERPPVTPEELLIMPELGIKRVTASKDSMWAYEREYRIVLTNELHEGMEKQAVEKDEPEWLTPLKVIGGARVSEQENKKLGEIARTLNIEKQCIQSVEGKLVIEDCN